MKIKRLLIFLLILLFLSLLSVYYPDLNAQAIVEYEKEPALVLSIVDGDTIETDLGTIRLLGINTPEKGHAYYDEAKDFLGEIQNQSIFVLRDHTNKDKYDRFLRYIFYNNRILNIEIVENGLATVYMEGGLRYKNKLLRAQTYAQNSGIGLWERSDHACSKCIELVDLNAKAEYFILKNICDFNCNLDGWYVKDAGRHTFKLSEIKLGQQQNITSSSHVWNNDHDLFFLRDSEEKLVIYYSY